MRGYTRARREQSAERYSMHAWRALKWVGLAGRVRRCVRLVCMRRRRGHATRERVRRLSSDAAAYVVTLGTYRPVVGGDYNAQWCVGAEGARVRLPWARDPSRPRAVDPTIVSRGGSTTGIHTRVYVCDGRRLYPRLS